MSKSGRYSPINSPGRKSTAYSTTNSSIMSLPPAYVDNGDSNSLNSKRSQAYVNLMNFLDSAESAGNDYRDDDMSSISNSHVPTPKSNSNSNYIWDNMHRDIETKSAYDDITYFRPPPSYAGAVDNNSVHSSSTMQSAIEEIKTKVVTMKEELKNKNLRSKQLEAELTRLIAAKQRKRDKCVEAWRRKLAQLHDENKQSFTKQNEFISRLETEISKLNEKCASLVDRLNKTASIKEDKINSAIQDSRSKRSQSLRQLESDEIAYFEKQLSSKSEAMKKSAAEAISPLLDQLVSQNRSAMLKRKEDHDMDMVKVTRSYRDSLQAEYTQQMRVLQEKMDLEIESSMQIRARRLEDIARQQQTDISNLQNRFTNEKKHVEDNYRKKQKIQSEKWLQCMGDLKEEGTDKSKELNQSHQRKLQSLISANGVEIQTLKEQNANALKVWKAEQDVAMKNMKSNEMHQQRQALQSQALREVEEIKEKLRHEFTMDKNRIKTSCEEDLANMRIQCQEKLDTLQQSEKRARDLHNSQQSEIGHLQQQVFNHQRVVSDLKITLSAEKSKKSGDDEGKGSPIPSNRSFRSNASRQEWQDGHGTNMDSDDDFSMFGDVDWKRDDVSLEVLRGLIENRFDLQRGKEEREVRSMTGEVAELNQLLQSNQVERSSELSSRRDEMEEEVARIEHKIGLLLSRKDQMIAEMKQTLKDMRHSNQELENTLDEKRSKMVSGASSNGSTSGSKSR